MSISINIPDDLYNQARIIADAHHIAVDEVFASAFADHYAALQRFRKRAAQGEREKFLAVLDKVPDVEPEDYDRLSTCE